MKFRTFRLKTVVNWIRKKNLEAHSYQNPHRNHSFSRKMNAIIKRCGSVGKTVCAFCQENIAIIFSERACKHTASFIIADQS